MKCADHRAVKVICRCAREHTIEKTIHTYFNTIANLVPYKKHTAEKWNLSDISWPLTNQHDQSARYSTFFTANSEKSGIAC